MTARSSYRFLSLAVVFCINIGALLPANLFAEDIQQAPDVANSKYQFTGTVNANAVYVRSGPGDNYYPTLKLDKGAQVTVVGIKFDWLKITPPAGSFSYVAKAFVKKRDDGTVGRVDKPDLNVRAGSALNAMKTTVQTKLAEGVDVKILGEQDEYFKIAPPEGSFVYVHKQFIDPGQPLTATAIPAKGIDNEPIASAPVPMKTETTALAGGPTSQPVALATPATQPVAAAGPNIEQLFDSTEADFQTASKMPIQDQPLKDLNARYESLLGDGTLPISMRRMVELRLTTLKLRQEAQVQFAESTKLQEEATAKTKAQAAEREELANRIKANQIQIFTAVGTLRTSSLQQGNGMVYRLTDPGTGRTLVYLRAIDAGKLNGFLGKFVGVKGDIVNDPQLNARIIAPTGIEAVDQAKVNNGVTANLIPASMMPAPAAGTVSITGN